MISKVLICLYSLFSIGSLKFNCAYSGSGRWGHYRTGWKMFHGRGKILERSEEVALGRMPCVTGFGPDGKIRELKLLDKALFAHKLRSSLLDFSLTIPKKKTEESQLKKNEPYEIFMLHVLADSNLSVVSFSG